MLPIGGSISGILDTIEAEGVGELALAATKQVEACLSHFRRKSELLAIESQGAPVLLDLCVAVPALVGQTMNAMNASCLLYTSPSPRDLSTSRMPSSA